MSTDSHQPADNHEPPTLSAEGNPSSHLALNASPDYFAAPKRGKGVRRLNARPLLIVAFLILLAVIGICYTFFQRQAAQQAARSTLEKTALTTAAMPPIRPEGLDYLPPAPSVLPPPETLPLSVMPEDTTHPKPPQAPPSEALQRRLRQIQQLEERRLSQWEAALNTESSVAHFNRASEQSSSGIKPNPEFMANRSRAEDLIGYANAQKPLGFGIDSSSDNPMTAENQQSRKQAFLAQIPEGNVYLAQQRQAALAPRQEIKAGWIIPGVMISGINSDLPGQIIGQVREAVYDSTTGSQCLIPAGARLIGRYDSGVTLGQQRALVVWQRIIYPDGSSLLLENMPGTDRSGYAGFQDRVDNHYARVFGSGLLLSVFSASTQLSQPQASNGENYNSSQIIAGSLGQQMAQIGSQTAQRNMNIQPTLEIRPGYLFNINVTQDILLPTWQPSAHGGNLLHGCHAG